jgi:hypothetical protein
MINPVEIFISSAPTAVDQQLHAELSAFLSAAIGPDLAVWNDRRGTDSEREETAARLARAHVVLLLVSIDYVSSEICRAEVQQALAGQTARKAKVIPILARATPLPGHTLPDGRKLRVFANLMPLPRNQKPVTSWDNRDEAWTEIAEEIERIVKTV